MSVAYSLWIVPTGDLASRLQSTIDQLGKKYSGPQFRPHVTLFSRCHEKEEETVQSAKALAERLTVGFMALNLPHAHELRNGVARTGRQPVCA